MKKILVIGESARDVFVYCHAERLAPDLPIPVLNVIEQKENPGMAMNVERNIKSILSSCDIVTNPNWKNVTKTRYMHHASNHAFLRVDTNPPMPRVQVRKIPLSRYSVIAISDYNKGFLSEADIQYICENHNCVFLDTKKILGNFAAKAAFIKINNFEYERSKASITPEVMQKTIVTQGGGGALFKNKIYPVRRFEVKDTSGAGDSFFAALVVKYVETNDVIKSIKFANLCASNTVQHRGVSVIKRP